MRLARMVAAGLVLGALVGFLGALLRPRPVDRYRPVPLATRGAPGPAPGGAGGPAAAAGPAGSDVDVRDRFRLPDAGAARR